MSTRRLRSPRGYLATLTVLLLLVAAFATLHGARTGRLALNTVFLATATVAISLPIGTVMALLLARTDLPARRLFGCLLAGFLFLPLYVQAGAWQAALGVDGWLTPLTGGQALVSGWRGAIWVHAAAAVPWAVILIAAGICFVDRELEEQALLDATPWQVARQVTLRLSAGTVGIAVAWIALLAAGEMAVTDFFQVRTFAEELYTAFALGDIQPWGASAPAATYEPDAGVLGVAGVWVGIAVAAGMLLVTLLLIAALVPMPRRQRPRQMSMLRLRGWRPAAFLAALLIVGFIVLLPLVSLVYKAGMEVVATPRGRARQWSARKCAAMVALDPRLSGGHIKFRHTKEIGWSLAIDSSAATASLLVGLPLAWLARRGLWRSWGVLASVGWIWAVPGPIVGLTIIALMNRPEFPALRRLYDRTLWPPILACFAHSLPLVTLILWTSLRSLPDEWLEAAELEGAGLWQRWRLIVFPLRWRAFAVAWIVGFVWSLGELDASILVSPPGVQPLSSHIFGLLHFGAQDQVAGLCLAVYLAVQFAAVVAWWLLRPNEAAIGS